MEFFFALLFLSFFFFISTLMQKECNRKCAGNCGYFRSVETIRGSYCSRDPSLAVILDVSQSNKSQVVLANEYQSDSIP